MGVDTLLSCVDGAHTFLVSKPSGMSEQEAPASAYLRAVPVCQDLCTPRGVSQPRSDGTPVVIDQIPPEQHVGNVFDASSDVKSVGEWGMSFPTEIQSLANQYEREQMSLCGLFSSTI